MLGSYLLNDLLMYFLSIFQIIAEQGSNGNYSNLTEFESGVDSVKT